MTTGLHTLARTTKRPDVRVGRGGKRGKTSGRGTKGQKARAGNKKRPELRDIIKKLPKLRGHGKNRAQAVRGGLMLPTTVTLRAIDKAFAAGEIVSPKTLSEKGVVLGRGGKYPVVKILATGELTKGITVENCLISAGAKAAVEKVGGSVK